MRMLYDISDVCRLFHLSPNGVRHYESLGLIRPERTEGGRRKYGTEEMRMLMHIKSMQALGFDLQTISTYFNNLTSVVPQKMSPIVEKRIGQIEKQIAMLQDSVDMLRQYEECLRQLPVTVQEEETLNDAIYFLPMQPIYGRTREEQEALSKWLKAIPLVRKVNLYSMDGEKQLSMKRGFCVKQDLADEQEFPLRDRVILLNPKSSLRIYGKEPFGNRYGASNETLQYIAHQTKTLRSWANYYVLMFYLYGYWDQERQSCYEARIFQNP